MMQLSNYEHDAFVEAFNIGLGVAAASLSEMTLNEVALSVPSVTIIRKSEALELLVQESGPRINGVKERFTGPFSGNALLLFPESHSLDLVRLLLRDSEIDFNFFTEMEEEALVEVGNIILNGCLGSIAEIVGEEIVNDIPSPVRGVLSNTLLGAHKDADTYVMKLSMDFMVRKVDIEGYIALFMDIESLDIFRIRLAKYFGFAA